MQSSAIETAPPRWSKSPLMLVPVWVPFKLRPKFVEERLTSVKGLPEAGGRPMLSSVSEATVAAELALQHD